MNILVAGSDGFVGSAIVHLLLERGHTVRGLNRNKSQSLGQHSAYSEVTGDVTKPKSLEGAANGCEAVIYLPGLLREFPSRGITFEGVHVEGVKNLAAEARRAGVRRWVQMSALGVERGTRSKYFQTKLKAEIFLQDRRDFALTIIRPSLVAPDHPTSQANFVSDLLERSSMLPFLPIIGDGNYRLQPIALSDIAKAFSAALDSSEAIGQTFEIAGPELLTMNEIVATMKSRGRIAKPAMHIPLILIQPAASLLDRFSFFPVTQDQIKMLISENIVGRGHIGETARLLSGKPLTTFSAALEGYFS